MSYATDGRCHNAQIGTFNHECGKPAVWIGTSAKGFRSGFCDHCKHHGDERHGLTWESTAAGYIVVMPDSRGGDMLMGYGETADRAMGELRNQVAGALPAARAYMIERARYVPVDADTASEVIECLAADAIGWDS